MQESVKRPAAAAAAAVRAAIGLLAMSQETARGHLITACPAAVLPTRPQASQDPHTTPHILHADIVVAVVRTGEDGWAQRAWQTYHAVLLQAVGRAQAQIALSLRVDQPSQFVQPEGQKRIQACRPHEKTSEHQGQKANTDEQNHGFGGHNEEAKK